MVTVTFILNTSADIFANWLKATWTPVLTGAVTIDTLSDNYGSRNINATHQTRRLAADAIHQKSYTVLNTAVLFELIPLEENRIEVKAGCRHHYSLLPWFGDLLTKLAKNYPYIRDTLEATTPEFVENETQQQFVDGFKRRIEELKADNQVELSRDQQSSQALFYLDDTTLHDAATFLLTTWNDANPSNRWNIYHYKLDHAYLITPMVESIDDRGRRLLTVSIAQQKVELRTEGFYRKPGTESSNPRAIEILLLPIGNNAVKVTANCNVLALLHKFTDFVLTVHTAFDGQFRLRKASFGIMDMPAPAPPDEDPDERAYFIEEAEYSRQMISSLNPVFKRFLPKSGDSEPARDDAPARDDEPANGEPARDDDPAAVTSEDTQTDTPKTTNPVIARRRERVANLKARGKTYAEMAEALSVSNETIKGDLQALRLTKGSKIG